MSGLFTTALTQAEILYGLRLLPPGRRRDDLFAAARPIFDEDMAGRILPFDTEAALAYPEIVAARRQGDSPSARSTLRSRRSRARAAPGWRPATCATSPTAGSK
jgi:predicted nucleic acid-binding protein